jgi:hypothetical protein
MDLKFPCDHIEATTVVERFPPRSKFILNDKQHPTELGVGVVWARVVDERYCCEVVRMESYKGEFRIFDGLESNRWIFAQPVTLSFNAQFGIDHFDAENFSNMALAVVDGLKTEKEQPFDRYNLVEIAQLIQKCIREYQMAHPYSVEQNPVVDYTLRKVLNAGKGIWSPASIKQLIYMERSAYKKGSILLL